ncbi:LysR substrate-binding domain-containing protein [Embleya sp. NBC_00896]|uniref:LysR substrate-binding domain-containing protein n=1 Tax=Embleya sp. NBC_00896 TaxID=2975961 RepID=UPI00386495D4|nr:LysR substrate-binding domain-containing protein [Embleya sp. NBC_00896]
MDVHTRRLRYFLAVAEELHFSRAAARLHISQQALSKQIHELEQEVGVRLLDRTTRHVRLSAAGVIFLDATREALAVLDRAATEAGLADRGELGTLRLGATVGAALELTSPILAEFARVAPGVRVELREFSYEDRSAGLDDGGMDAAFLRLPIGGSGIEFHPLFVEPLVVAVHRGHRLADRTHVSVDELADEIIAVGHSDDPAERFWSLGEHREPGARVVFARSVTEEMLLVAAGQACMITGAASARWTPHPDVRYLAIDDVPGSELVLGRRLDRPNALVDRFVAAALRVRDREVELVRRIEHPEGF